jgi:tRNA A37 methylthiotransferase MiaB
VGCLWAYAHSHSGVADHYELDYIGWRRDDVDAVADRIATNDVVVFSTYIWNRRYNYALARAIKKRNPNCCTVFGGPEMAVSNPDIFRLHPEIDYVIKGEGEITFYRFLTQDPATVPGLLINDHGCVVDTGTGDRITDLSQLSSPYLFGFFDSLVDEFPEVEWAATIETNRGCPYQCTFCDWGSLTYSKVKQFPLERIFGELAWISQNHCGVISVADANFGMFIERDNSIVDEFLKLQDQHDGWPYLWQGCWAKNQKKEVVDIVTKLSQNMQGFTSGLTLSFQSLDDNVLTNIRRKNMQERSVIEIFQQAEQNQITVHSELILGLPGETLESWRQNFYELSRKGIHSNIEVAVSQLLENAEMTRVQQEVYDIKTVEVFDYIGGDYNNDAWPESIDVTCSTRDLSNEDMIEALIFTWFFITFHTQGYASMVARFLYRYHSVDYQTFYQGLWTTINQDPWFQEQIAQIRQGFTTWFQKGKMDHFEVGGIGVNLWNIFYVTSMRIHKEGRHEYVHDIIKQHMHSLVTPEAIHQDVLSLQRHYVVDLANLSRYPQNIVLQYNIYEYLIGNTELIQRPTTYQFDFTFARDVDFATHIERIFYTRKTSYGRANIKNIT